jgi:hypothetical protein
MQSAVDKEGLYKEQNNSTLNIQECDLDLPNQSSANIIINDQNINNEKT